MKLALALCWHSLGFEELLDVVRMAEDLGYAAVYVDGDVSQIPSRGEGDVLDGCHSEGPKSEISIFLGSMLFLSAPSRPGDLLA